MTTPTFIYGTAWKEEQTAELVDKALYAGFTAFDTANQRKHYDEAAAGLAIGSSTAPRSSLFLQTKFTYQRGQDHRLPYDPTADLTTQVRQSFDSSLEHLQTDYVDSYLLHGPATASDWCDDDREVWAAMEDLVGSGQARTIGVSNISLGQLATLYQEAAIKPAYVQNRCYASMGWDREVRAFCRKTDIGYQGFSLLTANRTELNTPMAAAIASRIGASVPQVIFRFAIEIGMIPLTGTSNLEHMQADLACTNFELSAGDIATLEDIS